MDDGTHQDFSLVMNGYGFPDVLSYQAIGLITGRPYRFYVQALNIIGKGSQSSITSIYACADPSGIDPPTLVGLASST